MNKDFRLALFRENKIGAKPYVIDFTDYSKPAKEPVKRHAVGVCWEI